MKKSFLFLLILVLLLLSSTAFASQDVIEVKLNDKYMNFTDEQGNRVDPALINDRTMVPMRKIFETLGADIEWDGATRKVIATTSKKEITLQIENVEASVKDLETEEVETIKLDAAPVILNDRTMVPVRFIAESLEKQVGWDVINRVVVIIDYDEILAKLYERCSLFIEMMNGEPDTYDITGKIKGTAIYKDTEKTKNNQTINITGEINVKKSTDMLECNIELKSTGKGVLQDTLKNGGYSKINIDTIFDTNDGMTYTSSSLLKNDKWIKSDENENFLTKVLKEKFDFKNLIYLSENELTKDSYEQITETATKIESLFGNEKVKTSGKSTKTYTIKWGVDELLQNIKFKKQEQVKELLSLGSATVELVATYKNGLNTKSKVNINVSIQLKDTKEKYTLSMTIDSKYNSYNKNVKISLPKEPEIVEE